MNAPKVPVIVGPTAVGKTALSLLLAKKLDGEIVSADSRQVYKYMDIGTAKPTPEEQAVAPHHFIDVRIPDQYFSAGEFGRQARQVCDEIFDRKKLPIIVGGSGFYIQALVDGLSAPQESDESVKKKWNDLFDELGPEKIHAELQKIDQESANRLHPNDKQRIVRALEVYEITGKPVSSFKTEKDGGARFKPVFIGLTQDRALLYKRIEQRVDEMVQLGLVDEVKNIKQLGYDESLNALQTVGYAEVFQYMKNEISRELMIDQIKMNSRRYAKRQFTWFRKDDRINWFDIDSFTLNEIADRAFY